MTPAQLDDEELKDGEDLVQRTFQNLFPESFDGLIAVRNHKVQRFYLNFFLKDLTMNLICIATFEYARRTFVIWESSN